MSLAPPFTPEAAAAAGRLSGLARRRKRDEATAEAALLAGSTNDEPRKRRVLKQIDACDKLLDKCQDPRLFASLTAAKERLWNLVFPKAGVMRPRSTSQRRQPPTVSAAPQEQTV